MNSISKLESLPDEILLEICKYLLCVDVLLSFDNLNIRMTYMISDYRRHVSLHKATYAQSYKLCSIILPKIGVQIHTLSIDNCYSALQAITFLEYFQDRMSICFPELRKLILVSFRPDPLLNFLKSLKNLENLFLIDIRNLFRIPIHQQTDILFTLFQTNNQRLTSIYIDDQSSNLNPIKKYLTNQITCPNIIDLKIEISTLSNLFILFTLIPNIRSLSVSIHHNDHLNNINQIFTINQLIFLTNFQLKSVQHSWNLNELIFLVNKFPLIKCLSLNLRTSDSTLINGHILKTYLANTIEQFHYAIHYLPEQLINYLEIQNTWKSICPIVCLSNPLQNDYMFLHTLPYSSFDYLEISSSIAKSILPNKNFYENIQRIQVDSDFTLAEAFSIIGCCRRAKHTMIWLHGINSMNKHDKQNSVPEQTQSEKYVSLPQMPRLRRLTLVGSSPKDLNHMSIILHSAPNLFRLDLNYNTLLLLLNNENLCLLLQQRITALTINNMPSSSRKVQQSIARIVSIFLHLQHFYIDMRFLDITIDLIVLYYFDEFIKQQIPLSSFCADGKSSDEMQNNAKQWLINHRNYFQEKEFTAFFNQKASRLLIWL